MIWHHLITHTILDAATLTFTTGTALDVELGETAAARLNLAEVISRAAAKHNITLPPTDAALATRLNRHRAPTVTLRTTGCVLYTGTGRAAWPLGDGRTVESAGTTLGIIERPEPGRYTHAYRVPQIAGA